MSGIQYPIDIKDIGKFEYQSVNISVNVYGYKNKKKSVTYYHRDHCKTSREFIIYQCWWKISVRISERLKQTGIEII